MTKLRYTTPPGALKDADTWIFVGTESRLGDDEVLDCLPRDLRGVWGAMLKGAQVTAAGCAAETWIGPEAPPSPRRLVACVLPAEASRHNSPAHPHVLAKLLGQVLRPGAKSAVILVLDRAEHAFAAACAVPRVLPLFDGRSEGDSKPVAKGRGQETPGVGGEVAVAMLAGDAQVCVGTDELEAAAEGIRLAARLTDMPASLLNTDAFVDELGTMARSVGASVEVLVGEDLQRKGYGGLWSVGKTAVHPPALVVLSHLPEGAEETTVWVGKGIVYDTGGLSLKGKEHMPGMKTDMGGAAAVAGAFLAAVRSGYKQRLHAVFCLAENAIGPQALRPDDIITLFSGHTVEVNNTDAEGRLVLGDGVAHAVRNLAPDVIVDLATLTGAQLVATGRRHAAVVSNAAHLEQRAVDAGRASGDLVHPLPYCPEFFSAEFKSKVADMKNSVKDRANAQSSCAAQFIANHLGTYSGPWLHVDMAGPICQEERATGYGVALLLQLFVR